MKHFSENKTSNEDGWWVVVHLNNVSNYIRCRHLYSWLNREWTGWQY